MVPNGWSRKQLHDIASTFSGGTPSRRNPEYFNGNIPWIKSGEVNQRFIHHVEECITESAIDNSSAKLAPPNTILVAMYGATAGRVGMSQFTAAINQAILAVRPNHHATHDYLFYFLEQALEKLAATHVQGGQPNLNAQIVRGVEVLLPPLAEQQRITAILQTWEATINQMNSLIAAKRERKRGLMQVLLTGKKRFKEFEESKWITQPLAAHIRTHKKGKPVEVSDAGRGWPYVGSTAFDGVYVDFTEDSNAVMCEPRDVLLLWDGEYAGKSSTGHRGAVGSTVMALKLESTLNNVFFNNLLQFYNPQIRAVREGSGIPHMPSDFFEWFKPAIPPIDEQRKIASVLSVADAEIANLEKQLNAYKLQKRGLMQQLLTGRKRLKLDDLEAVA